MMSTSPATETLASGRSTRRAILGGMLATSGGLAAAVALRASPAAATPPSGQLYVQHPGGEPDETAIQEALDTVADAGGGHVKVAAGQWQIKNQHLWINANTRLTLTPGTVLKRTGALTAMLSNGPRDGSDTTTGGYDGPGNIIVEGGTWDFNARNVPEPGWGIVFGHAENIVVQNLEILDVAEWHAVEYNAIRNGVIDSCTTIGSTARPSAQWNQEALSIDLAWPGLQPFGAGDHTQSQMIRIVNNLCEGWPTFAGCHSGYTGSGHEQFVIAGNTARDLSHWGVALRNVDSAIIANNSISNAGGGIWVRPHDDPNYLDHRAVTGVVIADNIVDGTTAAEGVRVLGVVDAELGDGRIYGAIVSGNVVRDAATAGIQIRWAPGAHVNDNSVLGAGTHGIDIRNCARAVINSNVTQASQDSGLAITGGHGHQVSANMVTDAALGGDANAAIAFTEVTQASVQGNKVTSAEAPPRHALSAASDCSDILYVNNDVRGGYAARAFHMAGRGHSDTPGNAS